MKSFIKTLLLTGLPFGLVFGLLCGLPIGIIDGFSRGAIYGIKITLIVGLLFGLAMASFMVYQRRSFSIQRQEFLEDGLIYEGPANHFVNYESVGGWLFLTQHKVIFRSHNYNIQSHELFLMLDELEQIQVLRTLKIISNRLRLINKSGRAEEFIVESPGKWRDQIVIAQKMRPNIACTEGETQH